MIGIVKRMFQLINNNTGIKLNLLWVHKFKHFKFKFNLQIFSWP